MDRPMLSISTLYRCFVVEKVLLRKSLQLSVNEQPSITGRLQGPGHNPALIFSSFGL